MSTIPGILFAQAIKQPNALAIEDLGWRLSYAELAEKVRKALVNLLNIHEYNPSVPKTKTWEKIQLRYKPNSSNIKIGIIETNAIGKTYLQEAI